MPSYFDQWHFHDDAPIELSTTDTVTDIGDKDTFQRRHMAKRLATLLGQKPTPDVESPDVESSGVSSSFTVAICGPWGTGKTSLRNLTEKFLRDDTDNCPYIAYFNPRQWSNEIAIIHAFFNAIVKELEEHTKEEDKTKETIRLLRSIESRLAEASVAYGIAGALLTATAIGSAPLLVPAIAEFGFFKYSVDKKASAKEKELEKKQSFAGLQSEARKIMRTLEKPIVVFVDDLDRLTGPEVALVSQLLKFNADFPNVVYVLLADRVILESGLNSLYPGEGARYLEKFVQLQIDLPQPTTDAIQKQFLEALKPIAKELEMLYPNIKIQAKSSYEELFAPYLSTMRRVRLYFNALHFSLPLGKDDGSGDWEIFPFDFMLMELLRLYEPNVYRKIKEGGEWLTPIFDSAAGDWLMFDMKKSNIKSDNTLNPVDKENRIAQLYEESKPRELHNLDELLASAINPQTVEKIVENLFPNLSRLFDQKRSDGKIIVGGKSPTDRDWSENRRLCSPRHFARYFASVIPIASLKPHESRKLTKLISDRSELIKTIEEYTDNGQTDDVLEELELIARSKLKVADIKPFITALMDWGDEISIPTWSTSSVHPRSIRLCAIVLLALNRTSDLETAVDLFVEASAETTGFYIPHLCAESHFRIGDEGYFTLALVSSPEEERRELQSRLVAKLQQVIQDLWKRFEEMTSTNQPHAKPLQERSVFGPLLWKWIWRDSPKPVLGIWNDETPQDVVDWPSRDSARSWVEQLISTP